MVIFRSLMLLFFLVSIVCFVLYAATGQQRFKRLGLVVLKWTMLAGFGFFAVLIAERIA